MAGVDKRKKSRRLDGVKKKCKELSVLCDVDLLFLYKEDDHSSSTSFLLWPEDSNTCLSLIDRYKKTSLHVKTHNHSTLGKRKQRSDDQAISSKNGHECEGFQVGFLFSKNMIESQSSRSEIVDGFSLKNFVHNFDGIVDGLGYQELQKMMGLVDQATKCADEQLHNLLMGGEDQKNPSTNSGSSPLSVSHVHLPSASLLSVHHDSSIHPATSPQLDQGKRTGNWMVRRRSVELSILCDVDLLFLCKEDDHSSSTSFHLWPEYSNTCLSLIDRYKKLHFTKQRSDDQAISSKNGHECEGFQMGFSFPKNMTESQSSRSEIVDGFSLKNFVHTFDNIVYGLGYQELQKMIGLVDQATKCADE
ncbi:hypothetical protein ACOSQ3_019683 [Xanthoceras sorbifolium]